eukprot:6196358-Pleurochrysis_carterae.AAC.3
MSFSSVHRGGTTRDLSVKLRRLLLGSCGGDLWKHGGCFGDGLCVARPAAANGARALVARTAFIFRAGPCPTSTIINSGPDETLNLA